MCRRCARTRTEMYVAAGMVRAAARSRSSALSSGTRRTVTRASRGSAGTTGSERSSVPALASICSTRRFKSADSDSPWRAAAAAKRCLVSASTQVDKCVLPAMQHIGSHRARSGNTAIAVNSRINSTIAPPQFLHVSSQRARGTSGQQSTGERPSGAADRGEARPRSGRQDGPLNQTAADRLSCPHSAPKTQDASQKQSLAPLFMASTLMEATPSN